MAMAMAMAMAVAVAMADGAVRTKAMVQVRMSARIPAHGKKAMV